MINKFKVYDKKASRMYGPDEISYISFYGWSGEPSSMGIFDNALTMDINDKDRFTVLNYSGFKDSKGVEIYEKDLFRCSRFLDYWYEARYCESNGKWRGVEFYKNRETMFYISLADILCDMVDYPDAIIFGNALTYKHVEEEEEDEDE